MKFFSLGRQATTIRFPDGKNFSCINTMGERLHAITPVAGPVPATEQMHAAFLTAAGPLTAPEHWLVCRYAREATHYREAHRNISLLPSHGSADRSSDGRACAAGSLRHGGVLVTPTSQSGVPARPVVLFVLGSGRSGTSALTRVLSLCGGTLPPGMLGANSGNPHGFWEPRKAIVLNERILRRLGSASEDPTLRLYEEVALDAEARTACITKVRAYLSTLPAAPLVVIKEPKITLLSGVWFEAARLAGFHVVAVIAMRHPQEAIASLRKMGTSFELSSALWLKANLLAERHTRGTPRVFVEYTNLLNDWRREVFRISAGLAIDLHTRDEGAIEEFLNLDLRRQRRRGPVTDPFGTDWISTVYETLHSASQDEPWDTSALDRVFEEYRASEQTFRTALEEFRRIRRLNVGMRPSMLTLIYEVSAIAHRRSGTWA